MIEVKTNGMKEAKAMLQGLATKKIQAATVAALNDAARKGFEVGRSEMQKVFDRPTRWVISGIAYRKASKDNLTSRVGFSYDVNKQGVSVEHVLQAQVFGGARKHKRHEVALQRVNVLPKGMYIVPGAGAQIDAYGNMKAGQINQILSWFRGFSEQGYRANMIEKSKERLRKGSAKKQGFEYFVVGDNQYRTWSRGEGKAQGRKKLHPGIYSRTFFGSGTAIKPVMLFVRSPMYRKRFDFYRVVEEAAQRQYDVSIEQYLNQMVRELKP